MREYLNYTRFTRLVALISCEHRCENHCYVVGVSTKKSSLNDVVLIGLGVCTIHVHNTRSCQFLCDVPTNLIRVSYLKSGVLRLVWFKCTSRMGTGNENGVV